MPVVPPGNRPGCQRRSPRAGIALRGAAGTSPSRRGRRRCRRSRRAGARRGGAGRRPRDAAGVSRAKARSRASRSSTETIGSGPPGPSTGRARIRRAPAPVATQLLVTGIDEEPVEPWTEAFRVAEPRELTPGEEECLLDGVLGPLGIAEDPVGDRVAQVAVEVDQLGEGDVVAIPRPLDQPRPHGGAPAAPGPGASPIQMVAPPKGSTSPVPAGTGPPSRAPGDDRGIPVWRPGRTMRA